MQVFILITQESNKHYSAAVDLISCTNRNTAAIINQIKEKTK